MKNHNIVHYVTRQYMRLNRKRTFITFFGITLMVLLMTCVFAGKDTAVNYLLEVSSLQSGKWDVSLQQMDTEKINKVKELPYVLDTTQAYSLGMTEFPQSGNPAEHPYLEVRAYSPDCFEWMNISVSSGRLPENDRELVVSKTAVEDGAGLEIGDTVGAEFFHRSLTGIQKDAESTVFPLFSMELKQGETLEVPWNFPYYGENESFRENHEMTGEKKEYKIVGFIDAPSYEQNGAAGYAALTAEDRNASVKRSDVQLLLRLDMDRLPRGFQELVSVAGEGNIKINDYRMVFAGKSSDSTFNVLVTGMTVFFVVLIMLTSMILIYNVFNLSFRERSQYLGMLSSVGATAKQRRSSIYYEAFFLLAVSLPVGILAGIGIVKLGMHLICPYIQLLLGPAENIPVRLHISVSALAVIILLSAVTVLLSSFFPARRIAKAGTVESIRGNYGKADKKYKMRIRNLRRGAEGYLAACFVKRQRKKSGSVRMAGIVFMVLLFVTAFSSQAVHTIATQKVNHSASMEMKLNKNQWELSLWADGDDSEDWKRARAKMDAVEEELSADKNVKKVETWYTGMFAALVKNEVPGEEYWDAYRDIVNQYMHRELSDEEFERDYRKDDNFTTVSIQVLDDDSLHQLKERIGALDDGIIFVNDVTLSTDNWKFGNDSPDRSRSFHLNKVTDLGQGDTFSLWSSDRKTGELAEIPLQVAGFATNKDLEGYFTVDGQYLWIIMSESEASELAKKTGYTDVALIMTKDLRIQLEEADKNLYQQLTQIAGDGDFLSFRTKTDSEMVEGVVSAIAKITDILLLCFVVLTSIICLINLVSSIGGRVAERQKEFAVMESFGMTKKQMGRMLLLESIRILGQGIVAASLISGILTAVIYKVLSAWFGRMEFRIPYGQGILAVVVTGATMAGLSIYFFNRESSRNLIENIRNDMV